MRQPGGHVVGSEMDGGILPAVGPGKDIARAGNGGRQRTEAVEHFARGTAELEIPERIEPFVIDVVPPFRVYIGMVVGYRHDGGALVVFIEHAEENLVGTDIHRVIKLIPVKGTAGTCGIGCGENRLLQIVPGKPGPGVRQDFHAPAVKPRFLAHEVGMRTLHPGQQLVILLVVGIPVRIAFPRGMDTGNQVQILGSEPVEDRIGLGEGQSLATGNGEAPDKQHRLAVFIDIARVTENIAIIDQEVPVVGDDLQRIGLTGERTDIIFDRPDAPFLVGRLFYIVQHKLGGPVVSAGAPAYKTLNIRPVDIVLAHPAKMPLDRCGVA